jgi:hypothetical protein
MNRNKLVIDALFFRQARIALIGPVPPAAILELIS